MSHFLVQAHGADRPGMVASVTNALSAINCNLEDASMTRLSGHFTMLMSTTSDAASREDLAEALSGVGVGIEWSVSDLQAQPIVQGSRWAITVWGKDKVGIVSSIAECLAEKNANIEDLTARRTGSAEAPVYTVLIEVTVADDAGNEMAIALENLASNLGVTCHARPVDADTL